MKLIDHECNPGRKREIPTHAQNLPLFTPCVLDTFQYFPHPINHDATHDDNLRIRGNCTNRATPRMQIEHIIVCPLLPKVVLSKC
jgi:hypothetical protein